MVKIVFKWHDLVDQKAYNDVMKSGKLKTPEYKKARDLCYGAMYHPRFNSCKVIKHTIPGFGIVEFTSNVPKSKLQEYMKDVLKHLSSWGIVEVEVEVENSVKPRIKKNTNAKPKRKITKKCGCK